MLTLTTPEAAQAAEMYREAAQIAREAEELKQAAADRLKDLMGEAQVVEFPGLRAYHRYQRGAKRLDIQAVTRAGIDLSPYYRTSGPFQTFRTYEIKPQ